MALRDHFQHSNEVRIHCEQEGCRSGDLIRHYGTAAVHPTTYLENKGWTEDGAGKAACPFCAIALNIPLSPEATPEIRKIHHDTNNLPKG